MTIKKVPARIIAVITFALTLILFVIGFSNWLVSNVLLLLIVSFFIITLWLARVGFFEEIKHYTEVSTILTVILIFVLQAPQTTTTDALLKSQCVIAGEQYYANYLQEQTHNPQFSFEFQDISHESIYSRKLNTCLLYVGIGFKEIGDIPGRPQNEFIEDISNDRMLYFMSYGSDKSGNTVVVGKDSISSFSTIDEFRQKKTELFGK